MNWRKLPRWLKGGLIGLGIYILLIILSALYALVGSIWSEWAIYALLVGAMPWLSFLSSKVYWLLHYLINVLIFFGVGALIGLITKYKLSCRIIGGLIGLGVYLFILILTFAFVALFMFDMWATLALSIPGMPWYDFARSISLGLSYLINGFIFFVTGYVIGAFVDLIKFLIKKK